MNSPGCRRLLKPLPSAVLALVAGFLFAPAAARAECGGYVHFNAAAARQPAPANLAFAQDRKVPADEKTLPARPPCPCQGPMCQGGSFPPPLPAPSVPVQHEQWGCVAGMLVFAAGPPASAVGREAAIHSVRYVAPIFHPPRADAF